ncbi:MAG: restriction endonuclease subunit S [Paraclostridium sordellii]
MSCSEWNEYTLSELIEIIGGGTPKTNIDEYWNGDINWISIKDFNGDRKYILDTEKKITELGLKKSSTKLLREKDIIISARGTVGALGVIKKSMAFNQSCYGLRANNKVDSDFLYYLLNNSINVLKNNTHGSVFSTITKDTFNNIKVSVPKIEQQQKIANILSSLDDKIELNNEMNKTLEEMAQSIFKRWFVDFEFPNEDGEPYKSSGGEMVESELGMIPNGWEVKTIADIGDVISGGTPSTKNEEYYGGDISWITPKDLSGYDRKFISKGERSITEIGLQKSSAKLLPRGTVLFSSRAPIGYVAIAQQEVCTNQGFKSIVCNKDIINNNYVYYFLKYNKENIENVSSGSTFKEISGTHMKNIKIIVPIKNILDKFNGVIESFDKLLDKNYMDIDILAEVRDNLLPKLMSGELELSK